MLLFLLQLHRHAPAAVWDMVTAEDEHCSSSSWLHAIRQALQWLATMLPDLHRDEWTCPDILSWVQHTTSSTAQQIRHAVARFVLQEHTIHHVARMHRDIRTLCQQSGVDFADYLPDRPEPLPDMFACSTCSRTFSTVQGLHAHRWKQHGIISDERRYVYNGVCECCRKCFWTSQRLQQHLRYSKRKADGCFWWVSRHLDPLPESIPVPMPEIHRGQHRLPCVRAEGPQPLALSTRWQRQHDHAWKLWQAEWAHHGFPEEELSDSFCQDILTSITHATRAWCQEPHHDLSWLWCEIVEEFAHDSALHLQALWAFALWGRASMYDFLDSVDDIDTTVLIEQECLHLLDELPISDLLDRLERLHRAVPPDPDRAFVPAPVSDQRTTAPLEPISAAFSQQASFLDPILGLGIQNWPAARGVPICVLPDGRRVLLILHLFSGRRRSGDCHHWAHHLAPRFFPDIDILILSLDTAVGGSHCDLLRGPGLQSLIRFVTAGLVGASLSGPPCETWSAARHLPPPPSITCRWPRPLRSAQCPWGLEHLTMRELEQLATGSALLLSNIKIEVGVILQGGAAIQEHPEIPECEDYASIWRTSIQNRICRQAPGHQRLHIQQWRYGALAVKPTVLRVMGLPKSAAVLHAQADPAAVKPQQVLAGQDDDGRFKTACAKEYPEGLCRALIVTLFSGLAQRRRTEGDIDRNASQLGERDLLWLDCVARLSATNFSAQFLPDYQPTSSG